MRALLWALIACACSMGGCAQEARLQQSLAGTEVHVIRPVPPEDPVQAGGEPPTTSSEPPFENPPPPPPPPTANGGSGHASGGPGPRPRTRAGAVRTAGGEAPLAAARPAATAAPGAPSLEDLQRVTGEDLEALRRQLMDAPVHHSPLKEIWVERDTDFKVVLVLDPGSPAATHFPEAPVYAGAARIGRWVMVRVRGANVKAVPAEGRWVEVTGLANIDWPFTLTALKRDPARTTVYVDVLTKYRTSSGERTEPLRALRPIEVEVKVGKITWWRQIIEDVKPIQLWIVGLLTLFAGGVAWVLKLPQRLRESGWLGGS